MERTIERLSAAMQTDDNYYIGQDGLKYCSKCGTARQTIIHVAGKERTVNCLCACEDAKHEAEYLKERTAEIERNRQKCFNGAKLSKCRFDNSTDSPFVAKGKNYCKNFDDFRRQGIGLLLYGSVGTGKSHLAACIANELIDKGHTVLMTNFATIVNKLQEKFEGREEFIQGLNRYSLLILDDLGAERNTEFMNEQVFNVINSRYVSGKPMIITTNLSGAEMRNATDTSVARIYDRITERCHPILFDGVSKRRIEANSRYADVEAKLSFISD